MASDLQHIIQKVFLDVQVGSSDRAYQLKDELDEFLMEKIFPYLESYFNSVDIPANKTLQITELKLNLNSGEVPSLQELIPQIEAQLETVFSEENKTVFEQTEVASKFVSPNEEKTETLLFFLEHGVYPWWVEDIRNSDVSVDALLYHCIEEEYFVKSLSQKLAQKTIRKRIVLQLSNLFLSLLVPKLSEDKNVHALCKNNTFQQSISEAPQQVRHVVWNHLILQAQAVQQKNIYVAVKEELGGIEIRHSTERKALEVLDVLLIQHSITSKETPTISSLAYVPHTKTQLGSVSIKKEDIDVIEESKQKEPMSVEAVKEADSKPLDPLETIKPTNNEEPAVSSTFDEVSIDNMDKILEKDSEIIYEGKKSEIKDHEVKDNASKITDETESEIVQESNFQESNQINALKTDETIETPAVSPESANVLKPDVMEGNTSVDQKEMVSDTGPNEDHVKTEFASLENFSNSEPFYIANAGLILLHPFLTPFFKNCGLLNDKNKIKDKALAIHLLHYLATGMEQQYEHLHVMEKFLCDVAPNETIDRDIIISKALKSKAAELLESVLTHIPQLKSTSIALFRNEFLQRPGKLVIEEQNTKLIVERKTQDILLDNLPWNISLVKLPWHKKIFFVDW